jgi:hypothetical protein
MPLHSFSLDVVSSTLRALAAVMADPTQHQKPDFRNSRSPDLVFYILKAEQRTTEEWGIHIKSGLLEGNKIRARKQ